MERFTILKNDENIYRIRINTGVLYPRYMEDTDLMTAVFGSHRSKIINCFSLTQAQETIKMFLEKEEMVKNMFKKKEEPKELVVSDTFRPVED